MANLWKRLTGKSDPVIGEKKDLSEIVCIVDRSGSMETIRNDAIGGFNAFIQDQKEQPGQGNLTLVLFNDTVKCVHESASLASVAPLTRQSFVPSGRTAMFDAIGFSLRQINRQLSKQPPSERAAKIIVAILTDGEENSSKEFDQNTISRMIQNYRKTGWEFFYLAANQDAVAAASGIGIADKNTVNFKATTEGVTEVMDTMSIMISQSRVDRDTKPRDKNSSESSSHPA